MLRPVLFVLVACWAAPALADVVRDGGTWVIDANGASRAEVAEQLAVASGSRLRADSRAWLRHAPPLRLRWRAANLTAAWRRLLGDETPFALQCAPKGGCDVWVIGAAAAAPARRVTAASQTPVLPTAPMLVEGAETAMEQVAAAGPAQPDPPGLFPAD